jgi:nitroreductase
MFRDLVLRNRSYRRFHQERRVPRDVLRQLVDLARQTPSAANRQPLCYRLVTSAAECDQVFPHLAWAGYLTDWDGPEEGERPPAYVVILADKSVSTHVDCDHGIAAQTLLLGAVEQGLGGCMIGAVDREPLGAALGLDPSRYAILLVVALGEPAEDVFLETAETSDIRYWRDAGGGHHVPKRALDEVIVE